MIFFRGEAGVFVCECGRERVSVWVSVRVRRKYKEARGKKTWIHVCLFASYALCV